jgi:UDP-glucose 4-epimerase
MSAQVACIFGCGFIGRSLLGHLLAMGYEVRVLDHGSCPRDVRGRVQWRQGDFRNASDVMHVLNGADVAYHLVSSTVPGDTQVRLVQELNENVITTVSFLDACADAGVRRVVFASSSSVYGIQDRLPISEKAQTNPISAHGIQKLTIEKHMLMAHTFGRIDARIARISNPYGPHQSLDGRQGFVAISLGRIKEGKPVILRGNGDTIRDFIHVDDVAAALTKLGLRQVAPTVVNIGSGRAVSLRHVVDTIGHVLSRKVEVETEPPLAVDIPKSCLEVETAQTKLDWTPLVGLEEGLRAVATYHGITPGHASS